MPASDVVQIGLIVEGHGDAQAAPVLIRRLVSVIDSNLSVAFQVRRIPKSQLLQQGELERAVEALTRQIGRHRRLLVLIDADDDCPKNLAALMNDRCKTAHPDVSVSVVIANKEYEAWFLASARSLTGHSGLEKQLDPPNEPESIRGAKEWLSAHMAAGQSYSETRHQAAFSAVLDFSEARLARSFKKLEKEVIRLVTQSK